MNAQMSYLLGMILGNGEIQHEQEKQPLPFSCK